MLNLRLKKGFTLIELLVVIAIIALLVSILLPSLQKAKDLARGVVCMSNLKGISHAIMMYQQDYNGVYPNSYVNNYTLPGGNIDPTHTWYEYLQRTEYIEGPVSSHYNPIYLCPCDDVTVKYQGVSYTYNGCLWRNISVDEVVNPSTKWLVPDGRLIFFNGQMGGMYWYEDTILPRHLDKFNVMYADFSIGQQKLDDWDYYCYDLRL